MTALAEKQPLYNHPPLPHLIDLMRECVFERERERECVCVSASERERERSITNFRYLQGVEKTKEKKPFQLVTIGYYKKYGQCFEKTGHNLEHIKIKIYL